MNHIIRDNKIEKMIVMQYLLNTEICFALFPINKYPFWKCRWECLIGQSELKLTDSYYVSGWREYSMWMVESRENANSRPAPLYDLIDPSCESYLECNPMFAKSNYWEIRCTLLYNIIYAIDRFLVCVIIVWIILKYLIVKPHTVL